MATAYKLTDQELHGASRGGVKPPLVTVSPSHTEEAKMSIHTAIDAKGAALASAVPEFARSLSNGLVDISGTHWSPVVTRYRLAAERLAKIAAATSEAEEAYTLLRPELPSVRGDGRMMIDGQEILLPNTIFTEADLPALERDQPGMAAKVRAQIAIHHQADGDALEKSGFGVLRIQQSEAVDAYCHAVEEVFHTRATSLIQIAAKTDIAAKEYEHDDFSGVLKSIAEDARRLASAPAAGDAKILAAMARRQKALAKIEKRGTFFAADSHSERTAAIFDKAEMEIYGCEAHTLDGVLAKLWVGLSHAGGPVRDDDDAELHSAIRRRDIASLEPLSDLDFDWAVLLGAAKDLTALIERNKMARSADAAVVRAGEKCFAALREIHAMVEEHEDDVEAPIWARFDRSDTILLSKPVISPAGAKAKLMRALIYIAEERWVELAVANNDVALLRRDRQLLPVEGQLVLDAIVALEPGCVADA